MKLPHRWPCQFSVSSCSGKHIIKALSPWELFLSLATLLMQRASGTFSRPQPTSHLQTENCARGKERNEALCGASVWWEQITWVDRSALRLNTRLWGLKEFSSPQFLFLQPDLGLLFRMAVIWMTSWKGEVAYKITWKIKLKWIYKVSDQWRSENFIISENKCFVRR